MTALENVMTGRHLREPVSLLASLLRLPGLVRAEAACRDAARRLLRARRPGAPGTTRPPTPCPTAR